MSISNTPAVQFGGIISGIDTTSIINGLVSIEAQRLTPLQNSQKALSSEVTTLGGLKNKLNSFQTAAESFKDSDVFNLFTTSSSNENILTISANGNDDIGKGTVDVEVKQLAKNEKISSNGYASDTTDLNYSGTITINSKDVTVSAGDSLDDLKTLINNTDGIGVTATILKISDTDHRLVLTNDEGGTSGATYSDTTGTILQDLGVLDGSGNKNASNVLQQGLNSEITVDNVDVTRTSNDINDIIPGLDLNLKSAEVGTKVTLAFDRDYDAIENKVNEFTSAYNGVVEYINTYTGYDEKTKTAKDLTNSNAAHRVISDLRNLVNTDFSSVLPSGFTSMTQLGINTKKDDGTLEVDSDVLKGKMETNFDAFKKLFGVSGTSDTQGLTYGGSTSDTQTGTYSVDAATPSIGGDSATFVGDILTSTGGISKGLSVTSLNGSVSGNVTFVKGLAALFSDKISNSMLDIENGYITTEDKTLNTQIDDYDDKIAAQAERISSYEQRLTSQFTQMEMQINTMQSQSAGMAGLSTSLYPTSSSN